MPGSKRVPASAAASADAKQMTLTGRQRFRRNWRGQLILQVEEEYRYMPTEVRPNPTLMKTGSRWRDATEFDVKGPIHLAKYIPITGKDKFDVA